MISSDELTQIYHKLQYSFHTPQFLIEALSHPSLHQHKHHRNATIYERLEFLGDGILSMVISELIYHRYGNDDEGDLAKKRAYLVSSDVLSAIAQQLNLAEHIIMADGEEKNGGRKNQSTLEDIMEAIIAAIYLDSDFITVKDWIEKIWGDKLLKNPPVAYDSKTMLQEWSQGHSLPIPCYEVLEKIGSAHAPEFVVQVSVPGHPEFTAKATSIKKAEKRAAKKMLQNLEIIPT